MLNIIASIARELIETFFVNYLFLFLYVIIIVFIRMQYEKYNEFQSGVHNWQNKSLKEITEGIVFVGLVTGFAGSFLIIAAGITIEAEAVRYLFIIMFVLLLFNIRFVCFAYPAGILAIVSLLFNYPKVDVASVLGLAAIMHLIESILIFFNKGRDSIPVFIKHKGEIAGAWLIRKFWPVPVVFLTFAAQNAENGNALIPNGWGTLFGLAGTGALALGLDCIVAVLCYSDLAITKHPEQKSRQAAFLIFSYSLILFAVALFSTTVPWLRYAGAVFCIAGREGITIYGRHVEKKGKPLFAQTRRGLKVMDILSKSHAELMGMQRGDTILNVNGKDIQTEEGLTEALREYPVFAWIQVIGWDGKDKTYEYKCYPEGFNNLGIVPVPREKEVTYNTDNFEHLSILKNIVSRFRNMNRV